MLFAYFIDYIIFQDGYNWRVIGLGVVFFGKAIGPKIQIAEVSLFDLALFAWAASSNSLDLPSLYIVGDIFHV